ncbi:hypothetical protein GJ496_008405 [Pomphorhynchus laevis]|nr:hypothetical protein GJ496_008405 [Pomphorhynchus laevis]
MFLHSNSKALNEENHQTSAYPNCLKLLILTLFELSMKRSKSNEQHDLAKKQMFKQHERKHSSSFFIDSLLSNTVPDNTIQNKSNYADVEDNSRLITFAANQLVNPICYPTNTDLYGMFQ